MPDGVVELVAPAIVLVINPTGVVVTVVCAWATPLPATKQASEKDRKIDDENFITIAIRPLFNFVQVKINKNCEDFVNGTLERIETSSETNRHGKALAWQIPQAKTPRAPIKF